MIQATRPRQNYDALTVLRGAFAWWVCFYHVRHWLDGSVASGLQGFLAYGYLGVDFFFVLSGFVIHLRYSEFFVREFWPSFKRFFVLRIARIYPLHLCMSLVFLLNPLAIKTFGSGLSDFSRYDPGYYLLSLFLLHNWGFTQELKWNGPSWSISTEAFAYLMYPFLTVWIFNRQPSRWLLALLGAVILCVIPWAALSAGLKSLGGDIAHFGVVRCALEFALGCTVCALFKGGSFSKRGLALWFAPLALVLATIGFLTKLEDFYYVPAVVCLLIYGVAHLESNFKFELPALLRRMGEISYATYLGHYFVKDWFGFLNVPQKLGGIGAFVTFCLVIYVMSEVLYRLVELPGQRWVKSVFLPNPSMSKST
jgi:peptidoglycan/LPS O-acetylase OafA/YrhL